jgi:NAD(P)H-nitrite reductase large subunit
MDPDDHVCLCFHVSQRKLVNYLKREQPTVPSQLSECLNAGTGCQWCVPFLKKLHEQWKRGEEPNLPVSPQEYVKRRAAYHVSGKRDDNAERGE